MLAKFEVPSVVTLDQEEIRNRGKIRNDLRFSPNTIP